MQMAQAQFDWNRVPGGDLITGTEWLGADVGSTTDLHLRTIPQLSIDFSTQNSLRARLYPNDFTFFNGYTDPAALHWQRGFFALSGRPTFFNNTNGPFSRLHLVDDVGVDFAATYAQQFGWRPWMRNGVTFTGNEDQGYIGQKYVYDPEEPFVTLPDRSDMVLQWSNDYPGEDGPDRLRFLFTNRPDSLNGSPRPSGARSIEGLEGMRLTPLNDTTINVGVGDFFAGNLDDPGNIDEPTERLDVLNGRVRVRDLPNDPQAGTLQRYLVVDDVDSDDPEFGVIKWRNLPTGTGGGADCDWDILTGSRVLRSGSAAPNPTSSCPDRGWLYSVGTQNYGYKMQIFHDDLDRNVPGGLQVDYKGDDGGPYSYGYAMYGGMSASAGTPGPGTMTGVRGNVTGARRTGTGVYGMATGTGGSEDALDIHGVHGVAAPGGGTTRRAYGVMGLVSAQGTGAITNAYGVHGSVANTDPATTFRAGVYGTSPVVYTDTNSTGALGSWAGYFQGMVRISSNAYVNGNVLVTSDASLKTNVEDITNARELIAALQPKSYEFIPQQHPHMQMPPGRQLGLMAPEVQEVLPELVERVPIPAEYDTTGTMVAEATSHLAINYNGFIPVLIAAVKEQQQTISEVTASVAQEASEMQDLRNLLEEQRTRIDHMEQLLAECCNRPAPDGLREGGINNVPELHDTEGDRKLRIQPNPFSESTTVFYMLERSGRSQLMANSADGKQLRVLQEANLESGSYQYEWNTADLAAGIYYVTLLLDGQPVVKKAVKVNR
ncbi:MAG: tail fiber domain-containing protein [Flavobacteriales bacterium]|nr:tail fiber domain-containing protein [Flavobacteriales bacterium]